LKDNDNDAKQSKGGLKKEAIASQRVTAVLAATKPLQRIVMIELLGWAPEQDSDYADIMTPESDDEDIWETEYGEIIDPRTGNPRNTFVLEPYLFSVTTNQENENPGKDSPRNSETRNKSESGPILPQEYNEFRTLFEQPKQYVLLEHGKHDHRIPLQEGKSLICRKVYQMSEKESATLKEYIDEQL
jgi:hypothetical protein